MKTQKTFLGIPYNWDKPSWKKVKERVWNKKDRSLFTPKVFGWGYSINFYELLYRRKMLLTLIIIVSLLFGIFAVQKNNELAKAHSTFENYYAFRGCTKLLKRTGTNEIENGIIIKIVKYQNRWFLDGDLPCGFLCF